MGVEHLYRKLQKLLRAVEQASGDFSGTDWFHQEFTKFTDPATCAVRPQYQADAAKLKRILENYIDLCKVCEEAKND
jgi:hypothetical protein